MSASLLNINNLPKYNNHLPDIQTDGTVCSDTFYALIQLVGPLWWGIKALAP
jgi:hypothetical protein